MIHSHISTKVAREWRDLSGWEVIDLLAREFTAGEGARDGDRTIFVNNATLGGHVTVEDDAQVGAFTSVHPFCRVGAHAYIGGYSVITRDVLPYVKTVGIKPACYGLNKIGLERKGFTAEHHSAKCQCQLPTRIRQCPNDDR